MVHDIISIVYNDMDFYISINTDLIIRIIDAKKVTYSCCINNISDYRHIENIEMLHQLLLDSIQDKSLMIIISRHAIELNLIFSTKYFKESINLILEVENDELTQLTIEQQLENQAAVQQQLIDKLTQLENQVAMMYNYLIKMHMKP
jgi:hypothetical protein